MTNFFQGLSDALQSIITTYAAKHTNLDSETVYVDVLINEATLDPDGKRIDRKPLLLYLSYHAEKSQSFNNMLYPLEQEEMDNYKQELYQLIVNIKCLLNTPQTEQIIIHYNGQDHIIHGLQWGWFLSTSGSLIKKILFPTLKLSVDADKDTISAVFNDAFNELYDKQKTLRDKQTSILRKYSLLSSSTDDRYDSNEQIMQYSHK